MRLEHLFIGLIKLSKKEKKKRKRTLPLSVTEAYAYNSVHSLYGNGRYAGTPSVVLTR